MKLSNKIISTLDEAQSLVNSWRTQGDKIVFTNGCFDIIHIGHVLYLEEARSLGHRLVVGLNSDASIRKLKGAHRPINDLYGRMHVIAALTSVDMVIVFEEDTPIKLIEALMPDVLVKGGDWTPDQIVGSDVVLANGGEVKSLRFIDGYSTTAIEQKIKGSPL
jgi:D-glycero-beta-D-manno-heptose 1-phosphate adenylyltransferase